MNQRPPVGWQGVNVERFDHVFRYFARDCAEAPEHLEIGIGHDFEKGQGQVFGSVDQCVPRQVPPSRVHGRADARESGAGVPVGCQPPHSHEVMPCSSLPTKASTRPAPTSVVISA